MEMTCGNCGWIGPLMMSDENEMDELRCPSCESDYLQFADEVDDEEEREAVSRS